MWTWNILQIQRIETISCGIFFSPPHFVLCLQIIRNTTAICKFSNSPLDVSFQHLHAWNFYSMQRVRSSHWLVSSLLPSPEVTESILRVSSTPKKLPEQNSSWLVTYCHTGRKSCMLKLPKHHRIPTDKPIIRPITTINTNDTMIIIHIFCQKQGIILISCTLKLVFIFNF